MTFGTEASQSGDAPREKSVKRVLLVDDDEDDYVMTRDLIADIEGARYELEWAATYLAALEAISREAHDVYLLDYRLGERDGLALLREAVARGCRAPIILLTGQDNREVDMEAMRAGAVDYLVKGQIDAPTLERAIRYALARRRVEEELEESREFIQRVADATPNVLYLYDLIEQRNVYVNHGISETLGYSPEEFQGLGRGLLETLMHPDDLAQLPQLHARFAAARNGDVIETEYRMRHRNGEWRWLHSRDIIFSRLDGAPHRVLGTAQDITDWKRAEERLRYDAFHDALTELANRALFMDRLGQLVRHAVRQEQYLFAVLFLDLDRFKLINDSLGHAAGDQLLWAMARRLEACLRPRDTVARLGGDEFAVLLDDLGDVSDATRVAERIQQELTLPFGLEGQEVYTSVSIGIALSASGYERAEDLLRDADIAMYRAKAQGKSRYEVFDRAMHTRAVRLLRLETDLRRAIERGQLALHYQPIVALADGRLRGFEALVRWHHPQRGLVSPAEFIPLAEETKLILPIGEWVLGEACRRLAEWQARFPCDQPLSVSVNLSARQFEQPGLIEQVGRALAETGLDARALKLEITESVLMESPDTAAALLQQLRELGAALHLDDFGTGYSSLSYLHRFPIDGLKIDRSFVSQMAGGGKSLELVRSIIALARNLGLGVVAEGIETAEQAAQLRALDCEQGQGYLFSKPVESGAAGELIAAARSRNGTIKLAAG
jgi:diguanylate cyclase (GGDEF)-like protein/PAS domain S-box-containing protein